MRPDTVRPPCRRARLRLTLFLVVLACPLGWAGYKGLSRPQFTDLNGWDLSRVEHHLHDQGLGLRRVDAARMRPMVLCMFLTRTGKSWDQLERAAKSAGLIDEWQGTVYCEKWPDQESRQCQAAVWGDCCLLAGPYLFFGDRAILAEIHQALRTPPRPGQRPPGPITPRAVEAV
jgi:hypothetical protein